MPKTTLLAVIRSDECIGCGKCLPACPVDAIVGAPKYMHVVIAEDCIGCELCVAPCPVDCIDMKTIPLPEKPQRLIQAQRAKQLIHARKTRLAQQKVVEKGKNIDNTPNSSTPSERKTQIAAMVARAKLKRTRPNP